jgi:hypothetical protein
MKEYSDEETELLTHDYSLKLELEKEENRQKMMVRDSAKQKLSALGFSPNEISAIMGEDMIDHGSGLL